MISKTDAAVAGVADKLGDKALEYLNSFEELTKQYAPDVVNAALTVVQLKAVGMLISAAGVSLGIYIFWRFVAPRFKAMLDSYNTDIVAVLGFIAGGLCTAAGSIFVVLVIFDIWTYVAIFNPKLYIAARIFGKLF